MTESDVKHRVCLTRSATLRVALCSAIVALMANLSALVDLVSHPEIPYLDEEHLIVGGVTGAFTAILLTVVFRYTRHLERATATIRRLERFLPLCANCKSVRVANADGDKRESWERLEVYIEQHMGTEVTHGICPDCREELYGPPRTPTKASAAADPSALAASQRWRGR